MFGLFFVSCLIPGRAEPRQRILIGHLDRLLSYIGVTVRHKEKHPLEITVSYRKHATCRPKDKNDRRKPYFEGAGAAIVTCCLSCGAPVFFLHVMCVITLCLI